MIELKGEGCREFERRRPDLTWYDFIIILLGMDPSFKRIDVTVDDFSGKEMSLKYLFNKVKNKCYTSVFKSKPTYHGILEDGLTIDFGSRNSMTGLCVYDKKKQQYALGKNCDEEYWVRYEMRFRQGKAETVILDLLQHYKNENKEVYGFDLELFAQKALYATIDIKEDNNYSESDQCKAKTDAKWLDFVEETKKGTLPKPDAKTANYERSYNYIMPKAALILLVKYYICNKDKDLFTYELLKVIHMYASRFSIEQDRRLAVFVNENCRDSLTKDDIRELKYKLYEDICEMELPF